MLAGVLRCERRRRRPCVRLRNRNAREPV